MTTDGDLEEKLAGTSTEDATSKNCKATFIFSTDGKRSSGKAQPLPMMMMIIFQVTSKHVLLYF
jgi:hypothetical protein